MLAGKMKSGFSMTEPAVASSEVTNIRCEIKRDGDHYVYCAIASAPVSSRIGARPSAAPIQ
jgi:hypothetical protein